MAVEAMAAPATPAPRRSPTRMAIGRFVRHRGAMVGSVLLLTWVILAIFADAIAPYAPNELVARARQAPSAEHWLGTDQLGRDMLSRVIHGARISLVLGFVSVLFGMIPGVTLGLIAGYVGGRVDAFISRIIDAMLAFPSIILALIIIATLGPGILNVMIAVGISSVPEYARLTRGSVLAARAQPYVEAAWLVGNPARRIMAQHILPNTSGPLIVFATLQVGNAVLVGAGLSFLGLGAQPPTAEWGLMSAEGRDLLRRAWWIATFPGMAILTVVIGFNLIGDGLRDAIDPKSRPT